MSDTSPGARLPQSARLRALSLYRMMARIRAFEDAAEEASRGSVAAFGGKVAATSLVRGPLHLSTGQEAVAAGVCANLALRDLLTSTHRGHGHCVAKGASLERMFGELFGRSTGFNGGKGGSMHIADFSVGMLGANGVVAAGIPIAVGAAHALSLREAPELVACFFGDGAINRGPFLEGLNWAAVHRLPVLFVCEDNRWSATTATDGVLARAVAIGVPGERVDGNDVFAVDAAAAAMTARIRAGEGPQLLHAVTYRFKGHVSVDAAAYRDADEVARALADDPLERTDAFAAQGLDASTRAAIRAAAQAEVAAAVAAASAAPWPEPATAYTDVQDTGGARWLA